MKFRKFAQILIETSSTILRYFLIRDPDIYGGRYFTQNWEPKERGVVTRVLLRVPQREHGSAAWESIVESTCDKAVVCF